MEKQIPVKTLYLASISLVGLVALALGSTYAMFSASITIDNPISISSNLSYYGDVIETIEVSLLSGETKSINLFINNVSADDLNYISWYSGDKTNLVVISSNATGVIKFGDSISIPITIINNDTSNKKIIIGISSGIETIVLGYDMTMIENTNS